MKSGNYYSSQSAESLYDDLLECCEYDLLSEEGLREIFQRHGLTSDDTPITLSDYKFFHAACLNETVNEGIIRYLLEYFPGAMSATDEEGWSPLHCACDNKNVTLGMVRLLIDAHPASVRSKDNDGATPLHALSYNSELHEDDADQILKLLIEKHPEAVRHHDDKNGYLPIHIACVRRSPGFCRLLIDAAPDSVRSVNNDGCTPLHVLCGNRVDEGAAAIEMLKLLINAAPDSVRSVTINGWTPLHTLCGIREVDEGTAIQIMKLLIEKYPEAVQHMNNTGSLPLNLASWGRSPEFCRVLIEAYPGSERIGNVSGVLPLHFACTNNSLATVEYLYRLNADTITAATTIGMYPIHFAIHGTQERDNPIVAVEIVKFLVDCDPNVKLQKCRGRSLLHYSCRRTYNDSNVGAALQIIEAIYGACPEAIEDNRMASDIHRYHEQVQSFINGELVYARQAKDHRLMTTPDDHGRLPLHTALLNNVRLGSIKLLVKGNPAAVLSSDNSGALPLHIACENHDSVSVVQYLLGLEEASLDALDEKGNTALHYACRGAKYDTIALLLEKYDAISVSKRNAQNKLPIDLLWESNAVEDRESVEYTDSIFRLLKAYPELIMNKHPQDQEAKAGACTSQNEKKRKLDAV